MSAAREQAPRGSGVSWGIPFEIGEVIALQDQPVFGGVGSYQGTLACFSARLGCTPARANPHGFISPMHGQGQLAEHAADYVICYADGSEGRGHPPPPPDRRLRARWGENCFEAVAQHKVLPFRGDMSSIPRMGTIGAARRRASPRRILAPG